jgi:acyl phosphate:glycerol-3-phosphate acyltransferase
MLTLLLIATVVGYLLGSLPFGYLVARAKGVNIFEVGSKNPGATNVRRVLGHGPGNIVLFLDALKGAAAAGWPLFFYARQAPAPDTSLAASAGVLAESAAIGTHLSLVGLIAAILGHSFSCFTGFRGGKSVATAAGGFAVVFPLGMGIALAVFGVTLAISRYVSLASMLGAASLPFAAFSFKQPSPVISISAVAAAFVIYRHRSNLARIRAGTESKVGQKPAAKPSDSSTPPPKS